MSLEKKYEAVIGLEVHAQLLTQSKLFSSEAVVFGDKPNTHAGIITLAHPGTLPKLNEKAVAFAIKMGLACHCKIEAQTRFDRKNYFYPDLPKGYQISQHASPICYDGFLILKMKDYEKKVRINRIHLEEDAGKSLHDQDEKYSFVDLNRAGTALIEIVTEPDIRTPEEAFMYVNEIRKLVRFLGICDGNMEEGSLRCDANVSVRLKGENILNAKTEIKNLNSVHNVKHALQFEINRQISHLEKGEVLKQETRGYNEHSGLTFLTRVKETTDDYRYFPDPDLPPLFLSEELIADVKKQMPALPEEIKRKLTDEYALTEYDASLISEDKDFTHYFLQTANHTKEYKAVANWLLVTIKSLLNENHTELKDFPVNPVKVAELINLVDEGNISHSAASRKIFPALVKEHWKSPFELATEMNLLQESDVNLLEKLTDQALTNYPDKVIEYRNGKKGLMGFFTGEVMKLSGGKADPKIVNKLLQTKLSGTKK